MRPLTSRRLYGGKNGGNPTHLLRRLEPLPGKGGRRLRLAILHAAHAGRDSRSVLGEVALRRVPEVAECHDRGGVAHQLLQSGDRDASSGAVYAEGMAEVVNRDVRPRPAGRIAAAVVEPGCERGTLVYSPGSPVGRKWGLAEGPIGTYLFAHAVAHDPRWQSRCNVKLAGVPEGLGVELLVSVGKAPSSTLATEEQ